MRGGRGERNGFLNEDGEVGDSGERVGLVGEVDGDSVTLGDSCDGTGPCDVVLILSRLLWWEASPALNASDGSCDCSRPVEFTVRRAPIPPGGAMLAGPSPAESSSGAGGLVDEDALSAEMCVLRALRVPSTRMPIPPVRPGPTIVCVYLSELPPGSPTSGTRWRWSSCG